MAAPSFPKLRGRFDPYGGSISYELEYIPRHVQARKTTEFYACRNCSKIRLPANAAVTQMKGLLRMPGASAHVFVQAAIPQSTQSRHKAQHCYASSVANVRYAKYALSVLSITVQDEACRRGAAPDIGDWLLAVSRDCCLHCAYMKKFLLRSSGSAFAMKRWVHNPYEDGNARHWHPFVS
jgi:hypothetical protein